MKNTHLGFAALLAAVLFSSCGKTPDNLSTPSTVTTINKTNVTLFSSLKSTPQTFAVTAGVSSKIWGAQGTLLEFYPNSFKDKDGNILTSGTINIQLTEMYSVGDMIANRTSTSTESGLLTSGGEVNIVATSGGQEVFANKYRIGFKVTNPPISTVMELYYPAEPNPDSIVIWKTSTPTAGQIVEDTTTITVVDTAGFVSASPYFIFDSCTQFNFVNCDHPYNATSRYVSITVAFPDNSFADQYGTMSVTNTDLNIAVWLSAYQFETAKKTLTFKGWITTMADSKFCLIMPKNADSWYYCEWVGPITGDVELIANGSYLSRSELKAKLSTL